MTLMKSWADYCGADEARNVLASLPPSGPASAGAMHAAFEAGFKAAVELSATIVEQFEEGFSGREVVEFAANDIRDLVTK